MSSKSAPCVTGISPKEGPPGTRVTIRGENFGNDSRDIVGLRICGVDCLMSIEWKSPNKIIARTGQAKGRGDIIMVTRFGGMGTCTVQFRGYNIQIGPLQESAIWIDESQTFMTGRTQITAPAVVSHDADDPLGISDESSETKIPESELQELFSEGSGNTSLDNFEPAWFLLENHHGTSFEDLKAGLVHLKNKSSHQNDGPIAFAKTNLCTYFDCFDTLSEMNARMQADKNKSHGLSATAKLEETLLKANKAAEGVFDGVLGCKDRADATRNALSVLNRFKLLFYLPNTIEKNIIKGDYDLVITDYTRAKSLFWLTEIQAFRKVFNEIENRISAFREMIHKKLLTMPSTLDEQKKYIRYLIHLEVEGDPAWDCIINAQKWLVNLMHSCKQEQMDKEDEEDKEYIRASMLSPSSQLTPSRSIPFKSGIRSPQRVIFVDLLTKVLCDNLPDLWRLGQLYLSGKLLKEVKQVNKADAAKQAQFKMLMQDITLVYTRLIRAAFLPNSLSRLDKTGREHCGIWKERKHDSPLAWLPVCVRHVRSCIVQLTPLELQPECTEMVQLLAFDLRSHCVTTLLKNAIQDVEGLPERETWIIDTDDKRGGTTMLPVQFENVVTEMVHTLHEVVVARSDEKQLFQESGHRKEVSELCATLLQSFSKTLQLLADLDDEKPAPVVVHTTPSKSYGSDSSKKTTDSSIPTLARGVSDIVPGRGIKRQTLIDRMIEKDKRLIIVLSNTALTVDHVLPRLVENFSKHNYPDAQKLLTTVRGSYYKVDEQLFRRYIEVKSNPIIGALEPNMYIGHFDWSSCPKPAEVMWEIIWGRTWSCLLTGLILVPICTNKLVSGVRNYIKECIMSLLEVHAEVYSIGPTFVGRVMRSVVYNVAEELTRLMQCVTKFSQHGLVQGNLDVAAFDIAIDAFKSQETRTSMKEALKCVSEITPNDKKIVDELLEKFKKQMHFYLMCFQPDRRLSVKRK